MMTISKDYAPPFRLIQLFFQIGSFAYLLAMVVLLFVDPFIGHFDLTVIGWAHLFLLGFVMMIIFGAMAQLVPVVVEVGHYSIDLYYIIWPLLLLGTILLVSGFWFVPFLLPYGGAVVLLSMSIFIYETLKTLQKTKNITLTVKTVFSANISLFIAIIIGFLLTIALRGGVKVEISNWLGVHAVFVLGGFVTLTIIGLSMILLPMFGLAHGFDNRYSEWAFKVFIGALVIYLLSAMLEDNYGKFVSILLLYGATSLYLYQIWLINKAKARKENDIWVKSMIAGYGSLTLSVIIGTIALFSGSENYLLASAWFLIVGFFGFLINGHLFKIIPFLVWFEKFSPLVGKQKVPMLHEMLPKRMAEFEFWFTLGGVVCGGIGLIINSEDIFKGSVTLLFAGALYMHISVKWMLNFKQ